jgi:hypothetical protein
MPNDAIRQDLQLFRGEDRSIVITMNANGSIAGWTSAIYIRESDTEEGTPLLTLAGSVSDPGSASTPGVLTHAVTEAQTLTLSKRRYYYTAKRTNSGSKRVIAYGIANVLNDGENAAA